MAFNVMSMYQTLHPAVPRRSSLSWSIELHVNVYLISMEGDIRLGRVIPSISSPGTDLMEGYCRRHI